VESHEKVQEIKKIVTALDAIRFGSVEITIHDSKIVQIEIREKIRFQKDKISDVAQTTKKTI
jgi:hypothetical protein